MGKGADKKSFFATLPGILTASATLIGAVAGLMTALGAFRRPPPNETITRPGLVNSPTVDTSTQKSAPKPAPRCEAPYQWNEDENECVRFDRIQTKTISIPLKAKISSLAGSIEIYLNEKRLPGTDSKGFAMYRKAPGAVQMVIPIYKGKTDVSRGWRDVVYRAGNGNEVCSLQSNWPSTTGWLKVMHVRYAVDLRDCKRSPICSARLDPGGKHVSIKTNPIRIMLAQHCR